MPTTRDRLDVAAVAVVAEVAVVVEAQEPPVYVAQSIYNRRRHH
jgi:hypothetical protein